MHSFLAYFKSLMLLYNYADMLNCTKIKPRINCTLSDIAVNASLN